MAELAVKMIKGQLVRWSLSNPRTPREQWHTQLAHATRNLNSRHVEVLGCTPSEVLLGFDVLRRRPGLPVNPAWLVDAKDHRRRSIVNRQLERVSGVYDEDDGLYVGGLAWEIRNKDRSSRSKFDAVWTGPVFLEAKASDISW